MSRSAKASPQDPRLRPEPGPSAPASPRASAFKDEHLFSERGRGSWHRGSRTQRTGTEPPGAALWEGDGEGRRGDESCSGQQRSPQGPAFPEQGTDHCLGIHGHLGTPHSARGPSPLLEVPLGFQSATFTRHDHEMEPAPIPLPGKETSNTRTFLMAQTSGIRPDFAVPRLKPLDWPRDGGHLPLFIGDSTSFLFVLICPN